MTDDTLKNCLLNKMSIIDQTGDDHWLFTPLSLALDRIDELNKVKQELEVYQKALYMACDDLRREKCMGCGVTIVCEECDKYRDYFCRYLQKARDTNNG